MTTSEQVKKTEQMPLFLSFIGTGTPRGDPTELSDLGAFFSSFRNSTAEPLLDGSVKSNIGHTESAAGIARLLKVLLVMKNGLYVPSLHVKDDKSNLTSRMKFTELGLGISTHNREWPYAIDEERHACLNSFGFGGSNVHVIITQKNQINPTNKINNDGQFNLICLSGVNQDALQLNLQQFQDDIETSVSPHSKHFFLSS